MTCCPRVHVDPPPLGEDWQPVRQPHPVRWGLALGHGITHAGIIALGLTAGRCRCGHMPAGHHDDAGPCQVILPPALEQELPSWRCPCPSWSPWLPPDLDCSPPEQSPAV